MENFGGRKQSVGSVVNHVKVSFTQRDWNTAKEGMNKLLCEIDNISRENIYSIILDINENVFCRDIVFVDGNTDDDGYDQEKEEEMRLDPSNTSCHHLFDKVISFHLFLFCILIFLFLLLTTKPNKCVFSMQLGSIGGTIL